MSISKGSISAGNVHLENRPGNNDSFRYNLCKSSNPNRASSNISNPTIIAMSTSRPQSQTSKRPSYLPYDESVSKEFFESTSQLSQKMAREIYGIPKYERPKQQNKEIGWKLIGEFEAFQQNERIRKERESRQQLVQKGILAMKTEQVLKDNIHQLKKNEKFQEREELDNAYQQFQESLKKEEEMKKQMSQIEAETRLKQIQDKQQRMDNQKKESLDFELGLLEKYKVENQMAAERQREKVMNARMSAQKTLQDNLQSQVDRKKQYQQQVEQDKEQMKEYDRLQDLQENDRVEKFLNTYNKKPPAVYEELYRTTGYEALAKRDEDRAEYYRKLKEEQDELRAVTEKKQRIENNRELAKIHLKQIEEKRIKDAYEKLCDRTEVQKIIKKDLKNQKREAKSASKNSDKSYKTTLTTQIEEKKQQLYLDENGAFDTNEMNINKKLLKQATFRH